MEQKKGKNRERERETDEQGNNLHDLYFCISRDIELSRTDYLFIPV